MSKVKTETEDVHFYLDNAHPNEVVNVLRVLSPDTPLTCTQIATFLADYYGFTMQKDRTYSPRRLYDIGLATRTREGTDVKYGLNPLGIKLQGILASDPTLAMDLLHFLHYSGYRGNPTDRKLLWSYRWCCDYIWSQGATIDPSAIASAVQIAIANEFPHLDFGGKKGVRFNAFAASNVYAWLRSLTPCPIPSRSGPIAKRDRPIATLILLSLDLHYRHMGIPHGDPILLDAGLVDELARTFFMQEDCCLRLLRSAAQPRVLSITDTFSGPVVRLHRPYRIEDI